MQRRLVVLPVLALVLAGMMGMGGLAQAVAQDATPVGQAGVTCEAEPRSADELLALWYGDANAPDATPVAAQASPVMEQEAANEITIPIGEPADAETVAAVTETLYQVMACFAAGDILRSYGLFTDDLAQLFGPEPGTSRADAEAFLAGGGEDGGEEQSEVVSVANVMVLEDGRVGAFVVDRYETGDALTYVVFEDVGGRWLADEVIEFPNAGAGEDEDEG